MKSRLLVLCVVLFASLVGARPALADEHRLSFEIVDVGYTFDAAHQAYQAAGVTLGSDGANGPGSPQVIDVDWVLNPTQAVRNYPGGEFGSEYQDLTFTFSGFLADQVSLRIFKDSVEGPITAVLDAYGPHGNLVDTDSVILPAGAFNSFSALTVTAAADEAISMIRVSYGGAASSEIVDDMVAHVREGAPPPPPDDTTPPEVHITWPEEDYATVPSGWVSGYVDEDVGLNPGDGAYVSVTAGGTQIQYLMLPLSGPYVQDGSLRYTFAGPLDLDEEEQNLIQVTVWDAAVQWGYDSVVAIYDPPEYYPPPPEWPATLDFVAGRDECADPCGMEVTQVIQGWHSIENSVPFNINWSRLVAGKRTLVRVYAEVLGIDTPVGNVGAMLQAFDGAVELPGSPIWSLNRVTLVPGEDFTTQRADATKSFNFILPPEWTAAGTISLRATVNAFNGIPEGPGLYDPWNSTNKDVTFNDSDNLCVYVHPIRAVSDGNVAPTWNECVNNVSLTRQLFPVVPDRLEVIRGPLFVTNIAFETGTGWVDDLNLFLASVGLAATMGDYYGGDYAESCDHVVHLGLTDETVVNRGITPWPLRASISWAADTRRERLRTAHELSHSQEMWHVEECADPLPPFEDYPQYRDPVSGDYYSDASIGDWGVDIHDDNRFDVMDPSIFQDNMSYCDDLWMSPYSWNKLADHLSSAGGKIDLEPAAPPAPYLTINGTIGPTGTTTLSPAWTQMLPEGSSDHPGTGTYSLKLLNAAHALLFERHFDPSPAFEQEEFGIFQEVLPAEVGTRYIELSGGTIPTPLTISAGGWAPTVALSAPGTGHVWDATGSAEVRWTANDTDGDALTFAVFYSHDNGDTWRVIGADVEEEGLAVLLDNLPGCQDTCLVRVLASDGINQGEATSTPFSKAGRPPLVVILAPQPVAMVRYGSPIILEGLVTDLEEATMAAENIVWTSDRDGVLGTGSTVGVAGLSAGMHLVTLTATDSEGMQGSATSGLYIQSHRIYLPLIVRHAP